MHSTPRRSFGRLVDALPEARYEVVLAVLRGALLFSSGFLLLLDDHQHPDLRLPAILNLVLGFGSVVLAGRISDVSSVERARRLGLTCTAVDVVLYAAYSASFSGRAGAGGLLGAFVLLEGPIRYGLRGVPLTVVPVGLLAMVWPQIDASHQVTSRGQVVLLCVLFCTPAIVLRTFITRGSARLRQAEQQFATAFEHASIGMALVDLDLGVLQANRSLGLLVGELPSDLIGTSLDLTVDKLDRDRTARALRSLSLAQPSVRMEVRLRRPDGGLRWGHLSASLLRGASAPSSRIVVQIENVTDRKRSEAMLSHAAAHDALTDLPNRSLLLARLDAALARGERVGVLFLDLDRFKVVNDGLGHAAGDLLLVQVAVRLREAMRPEDMVARLGGDEFVVLCRNADAVTCMRVADRVLEVLHQPVATTGGGELVVGASIGVATAGPGDSGELVLRDADTAMYAAKQAGGGRFHVFSTELREAAVRAHELEVDLRAALRDRDLYVVYQPVVSLDHGRVLGCEALVRWDHPRRGQVPPSEFVAVAEQSDLILELGELVLEQALADLPSWPVVPGDPPPTVAVNVSLRQLAHPAFPGKVAGTLTRLGVDPQRLCLEVTETALVGDVELVIAALETLGRLGVRLSIDDFGTGHASLTYLARFPVDQVKVDQSFVAGLGVDAGSAAIVGGVVAMAHTFDLRVVAEGVEADLQLAALRSMGCDAVQGFLLGTPMLQDDLVAALRNRISALPVPSPRDGALPPAPTHFPSYQGSPDLVPSFEERRHVALLLDGAKAVTTGPDLSSVLADVLSALAASVTFNAAAILLLEGQELCVAASSPQAVQLRMPFGHDVSSSVALSGAPRYVADLGAGEPLRSWYGVPLIADGRSIGVLRVEAFAPEAFREVDRMAVLSFAPVVTLAVVTAQLPASSRLP